MSKFGAKSRPVFKIIRWVNTGPQPQGKPLESPDLDLKPRGKPIEAPSLRAELDDDIPF
jgi:hypothetical protein